MLGSILTSFALLAITCPVFAQSAGSGIEQLGSNQISVDNADHPHVESHIAVDPRDPQHFLATVMVLIEGQMRAYPYASFDGGKNWARGQIIGDSSITDPGAADPVVYITNSGICLFSTLGTGKSFVARSTDGGRTWRTTAVLPEADRQWLAFGVGRGLFGGRIYFTGTGLHQSRDGARAVAPFLARSDDDGLTFPFRTLVAYDRAGSNPTAPINAVPQEPLATSRGLFILTLQGSPGEQVVERAKRDSLNAWAFGLMISDDGGETFGPARYAPVARLGMTGSARRTFRQHAAGGAMRTAIDTSSSRFNNRIYFISPDYDTAIDRYVARVWYTKDFGKTWGISTASDATRGDIANPAIAVNRDGIVAITWNDRRDDPKGQCWRLYAALSVDGGEHFLPAQRLSTAPTCTNEPKNWVTSGSGLNSDQSGEYLAHFEATARVPTRYPMGGDTQGLTADGTGAFHAAWINGETGVMQLWYTSFRAAPSIVAEMRSRTSSAKEATTSPDSTPQGMEDITHDVRLVVTKTNLDFGKHTFVITIEIENQSKRPLYGPVRAVMRHFLDEQSNGLGLRNLAAANSDNREHGVGAAWMFETPGGTLGPGARSKPRELTFTFEGGIPEFPEGELAPGFRVYGRAE